MFKKIFAIFFLFFLSKIAHGAHFVVNSEYSIDCKKKLSRDIGGKYMIPLGLLSRGEKAEILEIRTNRRYCQGKKDELCQVEHMGLRAGRVIEMLKNEGHGPILLKLDESRIAIGRGIAMNIFVKRL